MKKYLTFVLLLFSITSFSQVNFFQTGATWGYSSLEHPDTPFDPYRIWLEQSDLTGDTTINGTAYKKIHRHIKETDMPGSHPGSPVDVYHDYSTEYLRYDTLSKKVFYINDMNTAEQLIYDFNLVVGDTLPNFSPPLFIDSIETLSLFGFPVKKFYYVSDTTAGGPNPDQYIIEGMGGSNGVTIVQPHDVLLVSAHVVTDLLCFQLGNNVFPSGSICDVFAGIVENEKNISQITLTPNPFQKNFRVNIPGSGKNLMLKIYDAMGREVYNKYVRDKTEIVDFTPTGLFNWKLIEDGKTICSGKILHPSH